MGATGKHLSMMFDQYGVKMRAVAFGGGDWEEDLARVDGPMSIAFRPVLKPLPRPHDGGDSPRRLAGGGVNLLAAIRLNRRFRRSSLIAAIESHDRANSWNRFLRCSVTGPGLPVPIARLSTFTTGITSAAVPVRKHSSAM